MFRSQAPRYSKCTLPQVAPRGGQRIAGCEGDRNRFQPFRRRPLAEVNACPADPARELTLPQIKTSLPCRAAQAPLAQAWAAFSVCKYA